MAPLPCPHCKRPGVEGEVSEVGVRYECPACRFEWWEALALDFRTD